MIEAQIGRGLREYFLPLTTETDLIEKIESLGNWNMVKKQTKGNWSSILIMNRGLGSNPKRLITGLLVVYNEISSKIVIMANIGEAEFPRIITIANFDNAIEEIEKEMNFLYGRGKNFMYVYSAKDEKTAREELDPINFDELRKSPLLFYLMKGHRKLTHSVKNQYENTKKARVILSSAQDFLMNKFAISKKIEDLSAKEFIALNREVNERILFECFFGGNSKRTVISKNRALNQRSVFIGAFLYDSLMKKVSYDEESWNTFFQTVAENFQAEAEEILTEVENAVVRESLDGLSTRTKAYLSYTCGESDFTALDWVSDTIDLTRIELRLHGDKLFTKDEYMSEDIKKSIDKHIKFVRNEMKGSNLTFSRNKGFDGQPVPTYRRYPSFMISDKDYERVCKDIQKKEEETQEANIPF